MMTRRGFMVEMAAAGTVACWGGEDEAPALTVGITSDVHTMVTNTERFACVLAAFARRKVDAVVVSGDLAHYGLESELVRFRDVWRAAFPENRRPDGGEVKPLFIYGDHDTGGYAHKHADYAECQSVHQGWDKARIDAEVIATRGPDKVWRRVFGEDWDWVRTQDVKGYRFILASYCGAVKQETPPCLVERFTEAVRGLPDDKPFFFVQHRVFPGTVGAFPTGKEWWCADNAVARDLLLRHPNAVGICGHAHSNLLNEDNIWRGAFTAVEVPSLHNCYLPRSAGRPDGFDRERAECLVMRVWTKRIVFERLDARADRPLAPDWVCRA